jgi:integrase/recombinase XerD
MKPIDRTPALPAALERPLEGFLDELRTGRRLSPRTVDAYARDLDDYARFARGRGLNDWEAVTTTLVDGYLASLGKRGLSAATVARRRSALRGFHAHRARVAGAGADPVAELPPVHRQRRLPHALTVEDVERLLAPRSGEAPLALRDRALLELAYASGLRVSELVGLSRDRVDLRGQSVSVAGKGDKERVVPFGRSARRALAAWLERGRPILSVVGATMSCSSTRAGTAEPDGILEDPAPARAAGLAGPSIPTCCGIHSPLICSKAALTSGSCRSCSVTHR